MEPRTLNYLAQATAGELSGGMPNGLVRGVSTDSRKVQPGELFVAVKGDRFDGHEFVAEVARRGVAGVVVRQDFPMAEIDSAVGVVRVDDPRLALGRLAAQYRQDFNLPIIAVAGSNGKTSTKELLAAVLGQKFPVLASEASFNNDIGVPLTLLRLASSHRAAVVEIGTNHPGELAPLIRQVDPQMGVITCIGREHLEYFGDLNGVLAEEGVLAEMLPATGFLFLNGDSLGVDELAARTRATVISVGTGPTNKWRARDVQFQGAGYRFTVEAPRPELSGVYELNLLGRPQVSNALLALAVGASLGLEREQLAAGLRACQPAKMRMELSRLGGVQLLNDAYNANADSTRVAFETLAELPVRGRRIAVLGDMAELGRHARGGHEEIGRLAAQLKIGTLFAIGQQAVATVEAARSAGLTDTEAVTSLDELAGVLRNFLQDGDALLLKASRTARLERLIEMLRPSFGNGG